MFKPLCGFVLASLAVGCAEVQSYGAIALEQRRMMNDLQARATMAATCDIAIGAYFRELSTIERHYAGLVCGGAFPGLASMLPAQLGFDEEGRAVLLEPQPRAFSSTPQEAS